VIPEAQSFDLGEAADFRHCRADARDRVDGEEHVGVVVRPIKNVIDRVVSQSVGVSVPQVSRGTDYAGPAGVLVDLVERVGVWRDPVENVVIRVVRQPGD